jgi:predicted amidohydrolase
LFTLALAGTGKRELSADEAVDWSGGHTARLREALAAMALRHRINVIGGSHLTRENDAVRNICFVALRDGTVHAWAKLHPTPDEAAFWRVAGGDALDIIETDCGPIGVLICYDSEFPKLARRLADRGALILFVPFCTETRAGYLRVRHCCAARAVENQCYVALAGDVGTLENVANMDVQYAQSAVLTPCDARFPPDGIAAEAEANVEALVLAELDMTALEWARAEGTVRNFADRRGDLYRVEWRGK